MSLAIFAHLKGEVRHEGTTRISTPPSILQKMPNTIVCLIFGSVLAVSNCVAADEFETNMWPGEGVPSFVAKSDELRLHTSPRSASPSKIITYRNGWKVPFDESIYRTIESVILVVKQAKELSIQCDRTNLSLFDTAALYQFKEGEKVENLQYSGEGLSVARVNGEVCLVPLEFEVETFGAQEEFPVTEWWVRVLYADGTSPGWLLVGDGQVAFPKRTF